MFSYSRFESNATIILIIFLLIAIFLVSYDYIYQDNVIAKGYSILFVNYKEHVNKPVLLLADVTYIGLFLFTLIGIAVSSAILLVSFLNRSTQNLYRAITTKNDSDLQEMVGNNGKHGLIDAIYAWLKKLYSQQRLLGSVAITSAIVAIIVSYSLFHAAALSISTNIEYRQPQFKSDVIGFDNDGGLAMEKTSPSMPTSQSQKGPSGIGLLYNIAGKGLVLFTSLVLFGYSFGQYRRVDKRITELRSIVIARKFAEEEIEPDRFAAMRLAVSVTEELPEVNSESIELGALSGVSSSIRELATSFWRRQRASRNDEKPVSSKKTNTKRTSGSKNA